MRKLPQVLREFVQEQETVATSWDRNALASEGLQLPQRASMHENSFIFRSVSRGHSPESLVFPSLTLQMELGEMFRNISPRTW